MTYYRQGYWSADIDHKMQIVTRQPNPHTHLLYIMFSVVYFSAHILRITDLFVPWVC